MTARTVGLVGGTGPAGRGVAARLAAAGHEVVVGSRDAARGAEVADELRASHPGRDLRLAGAANEEAAQADLVVLAAPWEPLLGLASDLAETLRGRTVVSMANALVRSAGGFLPLTMPRGSVAAEVQALLPDSRVVGAFHHLPAKLLADLDHDLGCEVLVFGEDKEGRDEVVALVDTVAGLRGIHAGGLASGGAVEALTAVLVQVNVTYRTHSMVRLAGNFDRA